MIEYNVNFRIYISFRCHFSTNSLYVYVFDKTWNLCVNISTCTHTPFKLKLNKVPLKWNEIKSNEIFTHSIIMYIYFFFMSKSKMNWIEEENENVTKSKKYIDTRTKNFIIWRGWHTSMKKNLRKSTIKQIKSVYMCPYHRIQMHPIYTVLYTCTLKP